MKIYVAGKWEEKVQVREVMKQLMDAGHTITHDWTIAELNGIPNTEQALADKKGVMVADALVCVFEKDLRYSGALTEFGIAVAKGIPIYFLGHACDGNIFSVLPEVHYGINELVN